MFGWWKFGFDATMLTLESQQVIGMRLMKLSAGGAAAQHEAERMVTEKVMAAGEAAMMLATGGSGAKVLAGYRRKVRANARRLSRG
ncbi:hypothetical protein [Methylobacterium sp. sgz302541]|uniref:hypothetical protein n=1 Tax=unclassified Methylobacterium TaxID=2615210 RepID=UPI003D345F31